MNSPQRHKGRREIAWVLCVLCVWVVNCPAAEVRYTVSLANPDRHYLGVTMELDSGAARQVVARMPAWNALYQVRDFGQYVSEVGATTEGGGAAAVEKIDKGSWRITLPAAGPLRVRYRVYADQAGPFGAQLNAQHAFLNPAQILMYTDAHRGQPAEVRLADLPPQWKVATALPERDGAWLARNYDHLADSPFEISDFQETGFSAGGGDYRIVVHAAREAFSMAEIRASVEKIVTAETALMRDVPFSRFTFIYHFREGGGGGMEHGESTAIDSGPVKNPAGLRGLESITAHEFFHLWNVKRIRPCALVPVDYQREQYTRALWFSEGVTSTYGAYTLLRSGLTTRDEFLARLGRAIRDYESRPARLFQSAEESSLDAWLEKYPYYGGADRSVSYYLSGELIGFLLDLHMRQVSENRAGLDDLLRYLNENYAKKDRCFDERADLREAAEKLTGRPFGPVWAQLAQTAQPIPWDSYLRAAGLVLLKQERVVAAPGFAAWRTPGRGYTVRAVDAGGAAERAGVRPGDELLAVNGRAPRRSPAETFAGMEPGSKVELKLRREGREFKAKYAAGRASEVVFLVSPIANPDPLQQRILEGWLSGKTN